MKCLKKTAALFAVVLALICAAAPAAVAVSDVAVEAGKTAELTFTFNDIYSADGMFVVADSSGIVSDYTISVTVPGSASVSIKGNRLSIEPTGLPERTSVAVVVAVTVKADAAVGSNCTVSFSGVYSDANEAVGNEYDMYQAAQVTVKAEEVKPPVTVPPAGTTTTPVKPAVNKVTVSYTELEKQITVANGLEKTGYTAESWEAVSQALSDCKAARKSTNQSKVDAAAKALEQAMVSLQKMDYSALRQALDEATALSNAEVLDELWTELESAAAEGEVLLESGSQTDVDAAAERISSALQQIDELLGELKEPQIVEVEVPVEVLPTEDYCNVAKHHVWPIVALISGGLNVALLVLLVACITVKKRRQDDTPLVDYDIGDDFDDAFGVDEM